MHPNLSEPDPEIVEADRLTLAGLLGEALALMQRRVGSGERSPREAAALITLSRTAEAANDLDRAQAALELALTFADWADVHLALGSLLVRRNRRAEARREFERALALNPGYRAAAVERALLDAREGRIGEALETLRLLAAETRDTEPVALRQGLECLGQADFEDAAPLLRRGLRTSDPWLDALLETVHEHLERGDGRGALRLLREAVDERPEFPDLHAMVGAQELRAGHLDDAVESLCTALAKNPDYHMARIELARVFDAQGDTLQALAQLEAVLERVPGHTDALSLHERLTTRGRIVRPTPGSTKDS